MSDQVNVGDYSLEISGDEVVVRDESGAIVETVELDDVDGELTLPDGQTVDLASILADAGLENFQTAAGPANDSQNDGTPTMRSVARRGRIRAGTSLWSRYPPTVRPPSSRGRPDVLDPWIPSVEASGTRPRMRRPSERTQVHSKRPAPDRT